MAIFFVLGIGYSLVVPPFETPDELFHYGFAHYVAETGRLPVQDPPRRDRGRRRAARRRSITCSPAG
ncbi:MAG: hypothetical protein R2851_01725 [Caldilineaceae bacterium]